MVYLSSGYFCSVIQSSGVSGHKRRQIFSGDVTAIKHVRTAASFIGHTVQAIAAICAAYVIVAHISPILPVNHTGRFKGRISHAVNSGRFCFEMCAIDSISHGVLSFSG